MDRFELQAWWNQQHDLYFSPPKNHYEWLWGIRWAVSEAFPWDDEGRPLLQLIRASLPEAFAVRCKWHSYVQIWVDIHNDHQRDALIEKWRTFRHDLEEFYAQDG